MPAEQPAVEAVLVATHLPRAVAGELDAYEALVRHFEPVVRCWVAPRCPPGVDIDEIAQRCFIAAFDRLGSFRPGGVFRAWLIGIARNELRVELRTLERRLRLQRSIALEPLWSAQEALLEDAAPDAGELSALRLCLDDLDDRQRRLLQQRYAEQRPVQAIAEHVGCPSGTIKKRLFTLRGLLRRCVERRLAGEG